VARARSRRGRPQTVTTLPPWPLDPLPVATPPTPPTDRGHGPTVATVAHGPTATPPRPGDDFYCRHCHVAETSPLPPDGWYRLQQRHYDATRVWYTRGLYCSPACLVADMEAGR